MKNFLTDRDGMSEKDYILLISTTVFFVFVIVGLVLVLIGKSIDPMYLNFLDMVSPVVMTIVAGVFGFKSVEVFANRKKQDTPTEPTYEEYSDYEDTTYEEIYPEIDERK